MHLENHFIPSSSVHSDVAISHGLSSTLSTAVNLSLAGLHCYSFIVCQNTFDMHLCAFLFVVYRSKLTC